MVDETAGSYNQRPIATAAAPMAVSDAVIALCRQRVEPKLKRQIRLIIQPFATRKFKAQEIGEGFQWGRLAKMAGARLGRYCYVADGSDISGPVSVGDLTMISTNVRLVGDDHVFSDASLPMRVNFPKVGRPATVIEADCWIGHGAILREGITLGRGTVVAAGAIVTKSTVPYSVVAGVPARQIKLRFSQQDQDRYDAFLYSGRSDPSDFPLQRIAAAT